MCHAVTVHFDPIFCGLIPRYRIFALMNKRTEHISHLIKLNISEIDPLAQVILYGSRARGDARKDSDWDILVLTDYPVTYKIEKSFRDHLYDLELETEESLSLFVYSKNDWNTRHHITPYYHNVIS
jgi:predicted nucleotidyltransferase